MSRVNHSIELMIIKKTDETWASMSPLNLSNYYISTHAHIYNVNTGRLIFGSVKGDGYVEVGLSDDNNKKIIYRIHRLVAQTFLPNPENKMTVDHIDRNKSNNHLSNLRWATQSEQNNNQRKNKKSKEREIYQFDLNNNLVKKWKNALEVANHFNVTRYKIYTWCRNTQKINQGFHLAYEAEVYNNEVWQQIPYPELKLIYYASNLGRIKNESGHIIKGSLKDDGYYAVHFERKDGSRTNPLLHRLVAATFFGRNDELYVNHRNGNKADNKVENLEYVTARENNVHAIKTGLRSNARKGYKVIQMDLDNNELKTFISVHAAAKEIECNPFTIQKILKNHASDGNYPICNGYRWKYGNLLGD